jgi:glutamate racemase
VRIISSAEETARDVAGTIKARRTLAPAANVARHRFMTTGDPEEFARLGSRVLGSPIPVARHLDLSELESMEIPPMRGEDADSDTKEGTTCS